MAKEQKINFNQLVSEARIQRIVEEQTELETKDQKAAQRKIDTFYLLSDMEAMSQDMAYATTEEDHERLKLARRELRNEVVVLNLPLVTHVLSKYGFFNADKFQNGCIGLLKASETFDATKGVPFHNYAAFCIETEVRLAFRRVNRMFESKNKGFLDSLDAPTTSGMDGDKQAEKHEEISDPYAEVEFDEIIDEAEVDTLFYDIIIPVIEEYGTRAKDIDMELWRKLEIQYYIELSMEQSQRQRITFTEMAKQLGTTTQNIRTRHKKVMHMVREACIEYGYSINRTKTGRIRFNLEDHAEPVKYRGKKHK